MPGEENERVNVQRPESPLNRKRLRNLLGLSLNTASVEAGLAINTFKLGEAGGPEALSPECAEKYRRWLESARQRLLHVEAATG